MGVPAGWDAFVEAVPVVEPLGPVGQQSPLLCCPVSVEGGPVDGSFAEGGVVGEPFEQVLDLRAEDEDFVGEVQASHRHVLLSGSLSVWVSMSRR